MTADPWWRGGPVAQTATGNDDRWGEWRLSTPGRCWSSVSIVVTAFMALAAAPVQRPITDGMRAYLVGYGTRTFDVRRDPWVEVDDATVAPLLTPAQRRIHRVRRISVDYDADGIPDAAWMVHNRTQMGVLVRLGATGRTVLAYRADGKWGDQQLRRAGRRAIEIEFPESTVVLLSAEMGRPMVYYPEE